MVLAPLLHSISHGGTDAALTFEQPPTAFAEAVFYRVDAWHDPAHSDPHKDSGEDIADCAGQ